MSRKYKDPSLLVNVKDVGEQAAVSNQNLYKLTDKYNKACTDIENLLAENKILRKLHGVPENFGFDLEDIKVAEKQELEDYKAQCRKLETEIEELEEERTQLRYRLRQFNTLFSNKGERYKDMTPQQLDMLDQYALNLKEGRVELPAIDKTHKEMEREIIKLKGQIEILQNKQSPLIAKPLNEQQSERVSVEALKRFEEQITKMINPLRDDVRRITETGMRGYDGDKGVVNIEAGWQFKPPMPLPVSHNDWSNIKEGFSYLYSSKIPIDLKDIQDEGGFSLLKAKYEVSALQLQNI
jgi:chromosome segregation ATPase